jgi:hypothetical protein
MVFFMACLASVAFTTCVDRDAVTPALTVRSPPLCAKPDAASRGASIDLTEEMVASAFAGMVTSESSSHSQSVMRQPPSFMISNALIVNPIDTALTSLALTACQALSSEFFRSPGSSICAMRALNGMPSLFGFANSTWPTGSSLLCCHSNGIGSLYLAPSGSTMSPMRSGAGVLAMPSITRSSSLTALIVRIE